MISLFLSLSLSILKKTDFDEAMSYAHKRGKVFVLAIDSDSYNYPLILHTFTNVAHDSKVDGHFLIVDLYEQDLSPSQFNASEFPCLSFYQDGIFYKCHQGHFSPEFITAFINSNNFSPIPYIATEDGLVEFRKTAALGFIAALDVPSQHIVDFMNTMHREHFNEITVAFANPQIFDDMGFYLYRFEDQMMFTLGDIEHFDAEQILQLIVDRSVPTTHHLSGDIANWFYTNKQPYIILNYAYEGFYINEISAREADYISSECELNVTYSQQGVNPIPGQLGIWPSKEPQMCIIDNSRKYSKHYCVDGELNSASAIDLCMQWRTGKAKKLYKSELRKGKKKAKSDIESINAYELQDEISKAGKLVIGIYYSDDTCLKPLKQISKEMEGQPIKFVQFSLAANDWSGDEEVDVSPLPRLVIYNRGKLLLQTQLANETQKAYDQITHAFYQSKVEEEEKKENEELLKDN